MKTYKKRFLQLVIFIFAISSSLFLSNCKGHVEIHGIIDSVSNCSAPYIVYFTADAEHRSKKLEYTWSFGDGTTSNEQKPMHIYSEDGVYQVNLHIKQNKVEDTETIKLYLTSDSTQTYSDWDYAIATDELWAPAKVEFQNYSKFATSYLWVFADGDSSRLIEPTHIYETPGTYKTALKAMCNGDTSTYTVDMKIKDSPSDIIVDEVTVWMPDNIIGNDIRLDIYYGNHLEHESIWISGVSSFPVTFKVNEKLRWFNGNYNSDLLEFIVFVNTDEVPEFRFPIRSDDLLDDFYPSVLHFDDGYGRVLEATIGYQD